MAIKNYRMRLTAIGPVHIGSGDTYGKRDYFFAGGKVAILDVPRFVGRLDSLQIERYCAFLSGGSSGETLQDFLNHNVDLKKVADGCVSYSIDSPLAVARRGSIQYYEVEQFVKDAYGKPYIPGSSIKGMIRTAILSSLLLENKGAFSDLMNCDFASDASRVNKDVQRRMLWRTVPESDASESAFDIMKYVSVSDSEPLSVDDLVFVKKYDKFCKSDPVDHKKDMGYRTDWEGNGLNIYRECLKPGANAVFTLSIDDRLGRYMNGGLFDIGTLLEILSKRDELYKGFLGNFDISDAKNASCGGNINDGQCNHIAQSGPLKGCRCRNRVVEGSLYCSTHESCESVASDVPKSVVSCYIGGGVGFPHKTILNALFDNEHDCLASTAGILFENYRTWVDVRKYGGLYDRVKRAGFSPKTRSAIYRGRKLVRAKEDHRHWRDIEFGVSPHTLKMGLLGSDKYVMGECLLEKVNEL